MIGRIILERNEVTEELAGKYVELYDYPDRPMEVRWRDVPLPYRVFSKDQRVSHTAIIENKRLGHTLAIVKAQQDRTRETKVATNSEKIGYQSAAEKSMVPTSPTNRRCEKRWRCRSDRKVVTPKQLIYSPAIHV